MELEKLTERIIWCVITVHRMLGPGFLEAIYERASRIEFQEEGIACSFQEEKSVVYRGVTVGTQRYDLLVENCLIVELKAIKALEDIHFAPIRSYLKALNLRHGLLFNFATMPLTIKRVIFDLPS